MVFVVVALGVLVAAIIQEFVVERLRARRLAQREAQLVRAPDRPSTD